MSCLKLSRKKYQLGGDETKKRYFYKNGGFLFHDLDEWNKFSDIDDDFPVGDD